MTDEARTVGAKRGSRPRSEPSTHDAGNERYELGAEIARGGMGRVVEATDTVLGRSVALKAALSTDPEALRRFRRETRITARLEHPSIVPVHDAGVAPDGSPFYVMRKVSGRPLEQIVAGANTIAERLALLPHVVAAAHAVAHAHRRGIIHRDIKPSNILVGELGETVVIDWGLAKVIDEPETDDPHAVPDAGGSLRTRIGTVFGTPGFMPAEQLRGEPVDARGDVYALGATLYYVMTRKPPHSASSEDDMMIAAAAGPPTPVGKLVPGVPAELSTIVDKALAFDHSVRYPDAGALAEDLQRFLTGQLVASHRYSRRERVTRFVRKNRVSVAIAAIAVAALGIGGWLAIDRIVDERDRADRQARLATTGQHDAEVARAQEADRADQLLLMQARSLVDANPTAAVALLKQLETPPARWDRLWRRARDIASGARVAGVAWGLVGPDRPSSLDVSPDGRRAVVAGLDGDIDLVELVAHTTTPLPSMDHAPIARFADDDHVIANSFTTLRVYDLTANSHRDLPLPSEISDLQAGPGVVYWGDATGGLWRFRVKAGSIERLPLPAGAKRATSLALAHDGRRLAVGCDTGLFVYDLEASTPPRRLATEAPSMPVWDRAGTRIGAIFGRRIGAFALAGGPPRWCESDGPVDQIVLEDDAVYAIGAFTGVRAAYAGKLVPRSVNPVDLRIGLHTAPSGGVVSGSGNLLHIIDSRRELAIAAPVEGLARIAMQPDRRAIVAATPGRVLVWDAEQIRQPATVYERVGQFALLDGHTAIENRDFLYWTWLDLDTGRHHPIGGLPPPPIVFRVTDDGKTVLAQSQAQAGAFMFHPEDVVATPLLADAVDGLITGDGTVVLATAAGAIVLLEPRTGRKTTLLSRAATPQSMVANGTWIGAGYSDGTVWRRDRATGHEDTIDVGKSDGRIALSPDGRVFILRGERILCWQRDGHLVEHARLPTRIIGIQSITPTHLVAVTADLATFVVQITGEPRVSIGTPAGAEHGSIAFAADLATYLTATGAVMMADLAEGERWMLIHPSPNDRNFSAEITDDGALIAVQAMGEIRVVRPNLPQTPAATAALLDQLTNATAELGPSTLTWH